MEQSSAGTVAGLSYHPRMVVRLALGVTGILVTLMSFSPSLNVFTGYLPTQVMFPAFAYISLAAAIIACLAFALVGRVAGKALRVVSVVCLAAFVLGNIGYSLLPVFPDTLESFKWLWMGLGVIVGIGTPAACLLWGREFRYVDVTTSLLATSIACMVYGAYLFACSHLGLLFTIPVYILSVVAVVMVPISHSRQTEGRIERSESTEFRNAFHQAMPNLLPPVMGLAVFAFVMGFRRGGMDVDETDVLALGFVFAGILAAVISLIHFSEPPIEHYYRTLLPLCAMVLVPVSYIFSLTGANLLAVFIVYALFGIVGAFSLAAVAIFGQSDEFNGVQLIAGVFGIYNVMSLAGLLVVENNPGASAVQNIVFLGVSVIYFTFLGVSPHLLANPTEQPKAAPRASAANAIELVCTELSSKGTLTAREKQIFGLLARGFSAAYISGALLISESTVRTHVNSIYRKLDVSSRDELLLLVKTQIDGEGSQANYTG